jgi:transcriptional regulator with XRE-family HTH domain
VLVRLPTPMSERLLDDLDDAWARLRGKELAGTLRSGGPSLRAIAGQVSVSAPYLSQLANGAGPVPSRTVLGKLEAGLAKLEIDVPKPPVPPKDLLEPIRQRVGLLRERLRDAERRQTTPQVTVAYPDQRIARTLEDQFGALATRSLDLDGGVSVRDLLVALIEEDDSVLDVLTLVVRDESLQKAVLALVSFEGDVKRSLLSFLGALVSRAPTVTRPRRDAKAPTPQKSDLADD